MAMGGIERGEAMERRRWAARAAGFIADADWNAAQRRGDQRLWDNGEVAAQERPRGRIAFRLNRAAEARREGWKAVGFIEMHDLARVKRVVGPGAPLPG